MQHFGRYEPPRVTRPCPDRGLPVRRRALRAEPLRPATAGYCHCTRCQRRTGTGSSLQARIDGRTLRLLRGEELLKGWRHPDGGFEKLFCGECGGHLFSRNPDDRTQMSVRMGAFDGDPGVRPSWRAYVAYAAPWDPFPTTAWSASPRASRTAEGLVR